MVREREGGEGGSGERIERKRTTNVVIGMKIGDGEHMNMYIHTYIHTYTHTYISYTARWCL